MQTITNIFIHNLSLTDIFMATLYMPLWVVSLEFDPGMVSCHCNISTYYGCGLHVKYCLNCPEQIHKSRQVSLVYQVLPQQKSYLVVQWSRLAAFSRSRHASVVRMRKTEVLLEFPSLHLRLEGRTLFYVLATTGGTWIVLKSAIFIAIGKFTGVWKKSTDNVNANVAQNGVGAPRLHHTDIKALKSCFRVVCFFLDDFKVW